MATLRPPTAEVTEIAGVIMPSPKNSPAPKIPSVIRIAVRAVARRDQRRQRHDAAVAAVVGAHDDPAYLSETTIISAQKISDAIP